MSNDAITLSPWGPLYVEHDISRIHLSARAICACGFWSCFYGKVELYGLGSGMVLLMGYGNGQS